MNSKTFKRIISVSFLLLIVFAFHTNAQTPIKPDCLQLTDSTAFGLHNVDSVFTDTCQASPTHNLIFAYLGYLRFKVRATHLPYYPDTSTIDTNWTVIDTSFQQLRSVFQNIDTTYGHFILRKTDPADTSLFFSQSYQVIFNSYSPCIKVDSIMSVIPDSMLIWGWFKSFRFYDYVIESDSELQNSLMVVFNGDKTELNISSPDLRNEMVTLYDIRGSVVAQTRIEDGKAQLEMSSIPFGIYFVKCGLHTKKVFIGNN